MTETKEYPTYRNIAINLKQLDYFSQTPDENGRILIGEIAADNYRDATKWSIVPLNGGYVIELEPIFMELDDDFEPILIEDPQSKRAYYMPIREDETGHSATDFNPGVFDSVEDAFDSFLDVVYTTDRTEAYDEFSGEAKKMIGGYIDAFSASFDDFKAAYENTVSWHEHAKTYETSPLGNALLVTRYPFLASRRLYDIDSVSHIQNDGWGEEEEELFEGTWFNAIPLGWRRRFGLELCEDIRNQLYDADIRIWKYRMCEFYIEQIKEKFGELRFYYSNSMADNSVEDIVEAYSELSARICINCGRADRTRFITHGWVSPYCVGDVVNRDVSKQFRDAAEKRFFPNEADKIKNWQEKWLAEEYLKFEWALENTAHCGKSQEVREMQKTWNFTVYRGNGKKIVNRAPGLLDGTPAPNGEKIHVVDIINSVADDIEKLEAIVAEGYKNMSWYDFATKHALNVPEWFAEQETEY